MKLTKMKIIIGILCISLFSSAAVVSGATSIFKIGLDGFTLDMTRTKGKVQVGNKMVPATLSQNGTTYLAAPAIGEVIRANYMYDSKSNTLMFNSYKKSEDSTKIKTLQSQVSTLKNQVAELQSAKNKSEGWLEYRSKHFTLLYTKTYEKDIKQVEADFEKGYEVAVREFTNLLPEVKTMLNSDLYPIYIYLHPTATDQVSEGSAYNYTYGTAEVLKSEIHVLTPSAYQKKGYTLDGGTYDNPEYFTHLFKHEFIHTPQSMIAERLRGEKGWYPGGQETQWIKEGQAEYLAAKGTKDLEKNKAYWKPIILKSPQEHITLYKDNLVVRTPYIAGYMFTTFLYEQYGAKKYDIFLTSSKPTLEEAFLETFGGLEQVNNKWLEWLKK
ncbi:hypothetical protein [Paenibacillus sp. OK003]|uniref:hypothetical protein n=1 Tax=Paenibacillus sp. OK003 TaxID=1884380 RepID=UPI0008ABEE5A|nr:hypothetical protein [Paenibacillus sp. OK003]SEL78694.1 hypothetical protein SAMN05518856_11873 [Paenibacillus sp. OK003]